MMLLFFMKVIFFKIVFNILVVEILFFVLIVINGMCNVIFKIDLIGILKELKRGIFFFDFYIRWIGFCFFIFWLYGFNF